MKPPRKHRWGKPAPASSRGYGAAHIRLRRVVLKEEPLCRECLKHGRQSRATVLDHIQPKCLGGGDERRNLQGLCQPCNLSKTGREGAYVRWHIKRRKAREAVRDGQG